jgi:hypothetical protein
MSRHSSIDQNIALIFITDLNFINQSKGVHFKRDYTNGEIIVKKIFSFSNPKFDFNLAFNVCYRAKKVFNDLSAEVSLLRMPDGGCFYISLLENSSLISNMSINETEDFIKNNINLSNKDHIDALISAMNEF